MIDLSFSSEEQNFIVDTSHDAKFARKLFGDLNHNILGPPAMARSSSSTTPMKKRRHRMRRWPAPNSWLLLLLSTQRQLPPPLPMMPCGVENDNSDDQGLDQEASGGNGNRCGISAS
jgi:hypothetical protein